MEIHQIEVSGEVTKTIIKINSLPDTCPVCLHSIDPRLKFGYRDDGKYLVQIVYQCPRIKCHAIFIAYYDQVGGGAYVMQGNLAPQTHIPRRFSTDINSISSEFVKIFNQALHSEQLGLSDIAGPGYRKSLEFLIKDYSILKSPEAADAIKQKLLSSVINEYVTDTRIKSTARRAAWLGNDETHYYRKWEDKDIRDMKILIDLTLHWVESEALTRQYEEDMTV